MEDHEVKSNPWRKPLIGGGVIGLVLICGLVAGLSRTDLSKAAAEYDQSRADAEKEGLYLSKAQLDANYNIPESENGAKLVSSVLPLIYSLKLDRTKVVTEKLVQDNWAKLEPAIAKIEEASHRKHLKFHRDYTNPAATTFPEYSYMKGWVNLFVQMGHFAAEKQDYQTAQKYWNLAGYLGNKQDEEGILIGMLVRIACLAIIEKEIQKTIVAHGKDPKMMAVLETVLKELDQPYDMKAPLKVECWFAVSMVDLAVNDPSVMSPMGGSGSMPNEIKFGKYLPGFKKANLSRLFRTYADGAHAIPSDPYDLAGMQAAYNGMDKAGMQQGLSYTMNGMLTPVFSQAALAMAKEVAQRNMLMQAVALMKSGSDPAKGLPLKDRHAMDVDGKSIRMKKDSAGWIIYSIGMDRVDDGGKPMDTHGKGDYLVRISQ
jgi:hypothetical protein